ncbi:hypothetical protein CRYUN_Cryun03dG0120700 [Craigia yunnanensis]
MDFFLFLTSDSSPLLSPQSNDHHHFTNELTVEEQNLLFVANKNVIGTRRASWRIVSSIEQKEERRGNVDHVSVICEYRAKIEAMLFEICAGILKFIDEKLVPAAGNGDSKVFLLTICIKCAPLSKLHILSKVGSNLVNGWWPTLMMVVEVAALLDGWWQPLLKIMHKLGTSIDIIQHNWPIYTLVQNVRNVCELRELRAIPRIAQL